MSKFKVISEYHILKVIKYMYINNSTKIFKILLTKVKIIIVLKAEYIVLVIHVGIIL